MNDFLSDLGTNGDFNTGLSNDSGVLSIGKWLLYLFLLLIPVVNIILLIVWSLLKTNKSRKNFSIATLIMISLIVAIIFALYYFVGFDKIKSTMTSFNKNTVSKYLSIGGKHKWCLIYIMFLSIASFVLFEPYN